MRSVLRPSSSAGAQTGPISSARNGVATTLRDCVLRYKSKGRVLAVASIYRDLDSLKAELAMEQGKEP